MTKQLVIRDVMAKAITISKSAKVTEALDKMLTEGADPLIALNNSSIVGTVSRQAIARKLGSRQNSGIAPSAIHVASVVEPEFTSVYPDESVNVVIPLLQRYKLVVVYDSDHRLVGQVSAADLLKKIQPDVPLDTVLEKVLTIAGDERVVHLRRRMLDENIHRFVVNENEKITGMVTETDVAIALREFRKQVEENHQDHRIRNLLVRDIMSVPLIYAEKTATVGDVADLMTKKNISAVPVLEKGKVLGVATRSSLVNAL